MVKIVMFVVMLVMFYSGAKTLAAGLDVVNSHYNTIAKYEK